ncbi:MAG: hypothetical protein A3K76_01225 [Euryarchaeota archaeon RBG_13_57_23]|nr:MAG: hypothetical protein A3K76_01225 [Euryarchaeota archaeon RBG_13_57_23]
MDPLMHILLPTLFLLAIRLDPKMVILLAPFTILPDFDAAFGLHRALFHSFVPIVILPVALIIYSKLKRPEWMLGALLVQFYLASHVVLDLGGVAFLWPLVEDQMYFEPIVTFNLQGGVNFDIDVEYGWKPYEPMTTTQFISESGFALIFLGALMVVVFRKEALGAARGAWRIIGDTLSRLRR